MNTLVVLIASPGDAGDERSAIRDALIDWTINVGRRQKVVALPWLYERSAVPKMGDRGQGIINSQAVASCDIVIAVFDSRLGTHTGADVSGTAEEIREAMAANKPVHVYFSNEDLPRDVDRTQLVALDAFKTELRDQGLLGDYNDPQDLAGQVTRALQHDIDQHNWSISSPVVSTEPGARLLWRHDQERESQIDKKGRMKHRNRINQLVVRNDGNQAAVGLQFTLSSADGTEFALRPDQPEPVDVHPDSEHGWLLIPVRSGTLSISARWTENDKIQEQERTITIRS